MLPKTETDTSPDVMAFFDPATHTISYVVKDPNSPACAIIDSVLDFDYAAGRTSHTSADRIIKFVKDHDLSVAWIIETHVHADHLTAGAYLKERLGGKLAVSNQISKIQATFADIFDEGSMFSRCGQQFDHLFIDDEVYAIGTMSAIAMATPGHTPACMTHVIGDAAFVGDTLFMPDSGTARVDFPGGDARTLYRSIQRIFSLPEKTRLFMCHDYAPNGRQIAWECSVEVERAANIHVRSEISENEFVKIREARDATLAMPALIIPSIQVNMRGGRFPEPHANGQVFLKVPVNTL